MEKRKIAEQMSAADAVGTGVVVITGPAVPHGPSRKARPDPDRL